MLQSLFYLQFPSEAVAGSFNSGLDKILKIFEDHLLKINLSEVKAILFCHDTDIN